MNLEQLKNQLTRFRVAAETALGEASKAIESEQFDVAQTKQKEADDYLAKAAVIDKQIATMKSTETPEPEPQKETPVEKSATRLPFTEDSQPDGNENDVAKAVNFLKLGTIDKQAEVLLKDLYGDYANTRVKQQGVFNKFVRTGRFTTLDDEKLLKTVILTPEQVIAGVQQDVSYKTMKATLQEVAGELGGYTVPEDWRAEVIKRIQGLTVVRGRARTVNTTRDAVEWPRLMGGDARYTSAVRVTWIDEVPADATGAESNPTFGTLRIPVNTQMIRTDVSKNLLEDSAIDIGMLLAELYSEAMAIDEDEMFLTGVGGATPKGVLGNRSGAEKTPDDGIGYKASGVAAALDPDGLIDLVYGLDTQYRGNAVLVGATATHASIRKMKDGESNYLWARGLAVGEPATLLNYPFYESEAMPAIAANAYPLIFGDFRGYVIADRIGMTIDRVTDTTTTGQNKVAFFARRRLGGGVVEPFRFKAQKVATS